MAKPSILIVGTSRSGTTNLLKGLSSYYNTSASFEPWNSKTGPYHHNNDPFAVVGKYKIVKCLNHQRPVAMMNIPIWDFYKDIVPKYDHVILQARKNIHDYAVSVGYQHQKWDIEDFPSHNWHSSYTVDENLVSPLYTLAAKNFLELAELSQSSGIPITWYDDLYSGSIETVAGIFSKLNLDVNAERFIKYLNPDNRLRKFGKEIQKI